MAAVSFSLMHMFPFSKINDVHIKQAKEIRPVLIMIDRVYIRLM